jgi:hypothetical protein
MAGAPSRSITSLNLAGDPVLDPHMNMAVAISKIKNTIDERLAHCKRLLITGRLGLQILLN